MSDKRFLFGAEVNRIQDTLFAAGLQRQVVGGSRLLAIFTEEAARKACTMGANEEDVIVKAGGTFRIVFANKKEAERFGKFVITSYHILLDGVMTVAEPIPFEDRGDDNCEPKAGSCQQTLCFSCANDVLEERIGQLKRERPFAITSTHTPSNAFCQSSGTQSAERWETLAGSDKEYMSGPAWRMKEVGYVEKKGKGTHAHERDDPDKNEEGFLSQIRASIPEGSYHDWGWARSPEEIAKWDPTQNNIAYLVADGNNIGKYFSQCRTVDQRQQLSQALLDTVYEAIADPIAQLCDSYLADDIDKRLPLLPLIAAGDDVFVMLPAPYALDYARRFCVAFSSLMNKAVKEIGLDGELPAITMSAAVVFCKQSYPYLLAHKLGEQLLGQTKRVVKSAGQKEGVGWHSAVSFDVIVGSAGSNGRSFSGEYRPTLYTYWADDVDGAALAYALPLERLFNQRSMLDNPNPQMQLPAKRRAELRTLFEQPPQTATSVTEWNRRLEKILHRIEASSDVEMKRAVRNALAELGEPITENNTTTWRRIDSWAKPYYAHGLPDLLALWNYAQSLDEQLALYR